MQPIIEDLGAIQAFVHAADLRSFKMAGQQLGLSSSAIGKAVQRLEVHLGVRLFHRSTRAITLTEEGGLFLARCRKVLTELELAKAELAQASSEPRGRLRVSLPVANALFAPLMAEFAAAHTTIELDLDFTDRVVDVIEEGFDAVIRSGTPQDSRLHHRKLGSFAFLLVASPTYLEHAGRPEHVCDLANHRCLRHRYSQTGKLAPWRFRQSDEAPNFTVPASFAATMVDPLLEVALAGCGIAALPNFLVRKHVDNGALQEVLGDCLDQVGSFYLLWPSHGYPLPRVRALIDFLGSRMPGLLHRS